MVTGIALKLLFTKLERFLLRNQSYPFVIQDGSGPDEKEYEVDEETLETMNSYSKYYERLVKGIYNRKHRGNSVWQNEKPKENTEAEIK